MSWTESAKLRAAEKAAEHVGSGAVIGLGSGSTAALAIRIIGNRIRNGGLRDIQGVPTSHQAADEALRAGVPLTSLDEYPELELTIDGVDQINEELDAIKGGGGALLREKVVASASKLFIIVADETKLTKTLGSRCRLPIEVLPFAAKHVLNRIRQLGADPSLRTWGGKLGPMITDNGNFVIDANFGAIIDPLELEKKLKSIPGVIETGLFLGCAEIAYIGTKKNVRRMERAR